jgi:hypothetical protein
MGFDQDVGKYVSKSPLFVSNVRTKQLSRFHEPLIDLTGIWATVPGTLPLDLWGSGILISKDCGLSAQEEIYRKYEVLVLLTGAIMEGYVKKNSKRSYIRDCRSQLCSQHYTGISEWRVSCLKIRENLTLTTIRSSSDSGTSASKMGTSVSDPVRRLWLSGEKNPFDNSLYKELEKNK